jgi:hypothetical protein
MVKERLLLLVKVTEDRLFLFGCQRDKKRLTGFFRLNRYGEKGLYSFNDKPIARRCSISTINIGNRTSLEYVYYDLFLYYSGLPLRRTSERLSCFIKRNHVLLAKKWNWSHTCHPLYVSSKRKR